jgi:hypothetical protein
MAAGKIIHVFSAGERDWVVREEGGRELGHYPTRREAQEIGHKLARKRGADLLVLDENGKAQRTRPRKGWMRRIFGR